MSDDLVRMILWAGERWRDRIDDPSASDIVRGCELDHPDLLPAKLPLHGMIWRLMAHGGELLTTHHSWITSDGGGVIYRPSITLGRSAAVAGVRALYIMRGENAQQRRIRALQLLNDEVETVQGFAEMVPKDLPELGFDFVKFAEGYSAEVAEGLVELGRPAGSKKTDTTLMTEAAPAFLENEPRARELLENHWRTASAVVHARVAMWNLDILDAPPEVQLAEAWGAPAQVLEIVWDTWNRMRGADVEGVIPRGAVLRRD